MKFNYHYPYPAPRPWFFQITYPLGGIIVRLGNLQLDFWWDEWRSYHRKG